MYIAQWVNLFKSLTKLKESLIDDEIKGKLKAYGKPSNSVEDSNIKSAFVRI